jgi:hypothetical protein
MPYALPKVIGVRLQSNISGQPANNQGTVLTSDGTAHVEPATETEIIAATDFDTDWVYVKFMNNGGAVINSSSLVNIKVGAVGSEQLLIPNLLAGWVSTEFSAPARTYKFPLRIPAGSRISGTHRSARVNTGVTCQIKLFGGGEGMHWTGSAVEEVGAFTGDSGGTSVSPGQASDGTLTSLGTTAHDWGYVLPMVGGNVDTAEVGGAVAADLGSSSSVAIPGLDEFYFSSSISEFFSNPQAIFGRFCFVPAGTTLHLRSQGSGAGDADDWVVYGVY